MLNGIKKKIETGKIPYAYEIGYGIAWSLLPGLHLLVLIQDQAQFFLHLAWITLHGLFFLFLMAQGWIKTTSTRQELLHALLQASCPVFLYGLDTFTLLNGQQTNATALTPAMLLVPFALSMSLSFASVLNIQWSLMKARAALNAKPFGMAWLWLWESFLVLQIGWSLGADFVLWHAWVSFSSLPPRVVETVGIFNGLWTLALQAWGITWFLKTTAGSKFVSQRLTLMKSILAAWGLFFMVDILGLFSAIPDIALATNNSRLDVFFILVKTFVRLKWPLMVWIGVLSFLRVRMQKQEMRLTDDVKETTGSFGTAQFASLAEIESQGLLKETTGLYGGLTRETKQTLFLPPFNRLIVAPPGLWKSTTTSIPALLSYNGPCFVFDVKGELWAVTARYRHQTLKRNVIAIDPFGLTRTPAFVKGKPDELLQIWSFNPFDWIPEDEYARDRMINAFASSFVINEGGFAKHFDENARILIRGYMDFLMRKSEDCRTLQYLFELMSEPYEEAENTFQEMLKSGGRAQAAASQILRVGADERGSILSTSYRQIDWISDRNIQTTLSHSNFDLRDFVKGNLDIYVILPEDQVKEHHRLVRMLMALLMSMIVQTPASELPKQKILFLLDELAQLGYAPDVEQCIEVLRARGVVVWTVFQTLSQIQQFEKPDLFKGASIKHIFTNDDTKTMEWIQTLAAKKTIRTKTLSTNSGDSRQKAHVFGGTVSTGEGESIQETGVDLIPLNHIRELPIDEQFIFIQGQAPIHAYKKRYFEHPLFEGRYDENPVEQKRVKEETEIA